MYIHVFTFDNYDEKASKTMTIDNNSIYTCKLNLNKIPTETV